MKHSVRRALLSSCALALLVPGAAVAVGPLDAEQSLATKGKGLSLVQSGLTGPGGTDLEFFSRTLTSYRDASNQLITPEAPVERYFALVGNQTSGAKVVDITDPERSFVVSGLSNCNVGQGDVQVTKDGRLDIPRL